MVKNLKKKRIRLPYFLILCLAGILAYTVFALVLPGARQKDQALTGQEKMRQKTPAPAGEGELSEGEKLLPQTDHKNRKEESLEGQTTEEDSQEGEKAVEEIEVNAVGVQEIEGLMSEKPAEIHSADTGQIDPANTREGRPDASQAAAMAYQTVTTAGGVWSVFVCDLNGSAYSVLNNHAMQAASLIKLFIMGAVYEDYESLEAVYGREALDQLLTSMITISDNEAANQLVTWLGEGDSQAGMQRVNDYCADHGYQDTSMGRLLLQGRENGDNYTSALDCGKFLYRLYRRGYVGQGEGKEISQKEAAMFRLLAGQTRRNKIPAQLPGQVQTANKTGELADVENDAGILYSCENDLILVFLSEELPATGLAQTVIAQASRRLYDHFNWDLG
ncbi:MAG: serine hydrolase [Blautia sp.]|nr:serine hydrolase [Blautia sp.]